MSKKINEIAFKLDYIYSCYMNKIEDMRDFKNLLLSTERKITSLLGAIEISIDKSQPKKLKFKTDTFYKMRNGNKAYLYSLDRVEMRCVDVVNQSDYSLTLEGLYYNSRVPIESEFDLIEEWIEE